jgi:hypothetical protein
LRPLIQNTRKSISVNTSVPPVIFEIKTPMFEQTKTVTSPKVITLMCCRLSCLVVTVPGYRFRGPGFDSRPYHIFLVGVDLERDPLSLVRITEELLE